MKKRLLFQFLAVMGVMSASAYNSDEYIYTPDAKYKTTTNNVVTNGDFTNQFAGWTNGSDETAGEPATDAWALVDGVGPNQETAAEAVSDASGSVLARIWTVDELGGSGLYVYSYYIMGTAAGNTSNTAGSANYVGFYVNQEGTFASNTRTVADNAAFTSEWTMVSDTVNLNQGDFFVMYIDRLAAGTRIANVSINKVDPVFDDRLLQAKKSYVESILANGWLDNGVEDFKGELEEIYSAFNGEAGDDPDDIDAMTAYLDMIDESIEAFFENNSASMMNNFTHWNANSNKGQKLSSIGDWVLTSGRWFHCNSNDSGTREELRETISLEMPRAFDLPSGNATVTKTWEPGKYFMYLDVKGYYMLKGTSSQYDADLNSEVKGCTIFGNDQTIDLGTLNTRRNNRYIIFFEIPEDQAGVEGNVKFGFDYTMPAEEKDVKRGGYISLSNLRVRRVGLSEAQMAHINLVKSIAEAQNALKVMIDSAQVVATKGDIYKWGMAQMNDSTAKGQEAYTASLAKVDENGKEVSVDDDADAEYPTTLKDYMNIVRKGMQNLYGYCQPYFNLVDAVAEAEGKLADPLNANGDAALKAAYEQAIRDAKALIATYATLEDDAAIQEEIAKYNEKLAALQAAQTAYLLTTASLENPTSIAIKNGDFATGTTSGWTFTETVSGKENFKKSTNDSYDSGLCLAVGRGYTVSPQSKLVQDVNLTHKGLYAYVANAHAMNVIPGNDYGQAEIIEADEENGIAADTIFICDKNKVHLIFGQLGAEDSVPVHSRLIEYNFSYSKSDWNGQQDYGYEAGEYVIYAEKSDDAEAAFELGMYTYGQVDGAGSNIYGFGDNQVLYLGDAAKAYADIKAKMEGNVAKAKAAAAAAATSEAQGVLNVVSRLNRRLADAEKLLAGSLTNAKEFTRANNAVNYVMDLTKRLEERVAASTGIDNVSVDTVKAHIVEGVYNLAGVRVANDLESLRSLSKGIYLFNGKKYVVK
ncbi:MAG: hypothetical protein ACI3YM_08860 [Prevotella sp.]